MRIIAFFVTLLIGISVGSFFKSSYKHTHTKCNLSYLTESRSDKSEPKSFSFTPRNFDASKNYTKEEAVELVGKRIRNLEGGSAKCPKESGNCLNLYIGETGEVVNILPSLNDTYLIEIRWDENSESDLYSHSGRSVTRADKSFSFEIIE
jgi:hypothetical protein